MLVGYNLPVAVVGCGIPVSLRQSLSNPCSFAVLGYYLFQRGL